MKYDFSGYVTKNDILCSDGRTIRKDAFKDNDGDVVPLVWNHDHNDPMNVLGHVLLENRNDGVYGYGLFNDSDSGKTAKMLVKHGDIDSMSIYANQLKQQSGNVVHGNIREVSLVLAGANTGARIDTVSIEHGEDGDLESAIIYQDADGINIDPDDDLVNKTYIFHGDNMPNNDTSSANNLSKDATVGDVINSMTDMQRNIMYALIYAAMKGDISLPDDTAEQSDNSDYILGDHVSEGTMKHNVFDNDANVIGDDVIAHSDVMDAIADAKRYGSMKESFAQHGLEDIALAHADGDVVRPSGSANYGINGVDFLFPDVRNVTDQPIFIKRDTAWVSDIMNGTTHSPFSRIRSIFADITEDDARAKGYIKGKLKKEEVFSLLKRSTTPTTVYKKQKMDRDDIVDITDFDVIAWLKAEMRSMLDEEIARAILVGDGRLSSSDDKINEQNIRPIWTDADLFTIKRTIDGAKFTTGARKASEFIDEAVRARKDYKGSGNPALYTTTDMVTECLLLKDNDGHRMFKDSSELAQAMRVSRIVEVPVMDNLTRTGSDSAKYDLGGIIVNPADYSIGADKGGSVSMFDDFDIDYNQQKYLIETRCSGALTVPYSAIAIEFKQASV